VRPRKRRVGNRQPALRDFTIPLVMTAIMLVMGIVFGSVGAQTLDQREKGELIEYLSRFGQSLADSISGARVPIQSAILTNLQKLAIIWVLAATVIGSPAILLVIFLQGFASGFTVAILVEEWSIRGLVLALASVVPHNLFAVSGLVLSGSAGLGHAWSTVRSVAGSGSLPSWKRLVSFTVICLLCSILLVLAAVVESQVSPFLVRRVAPFVF
jgi:stage II sporulation protein M